MPYAADEADAALLIWLFVESDGGQGFRVRLTATRGLDPEPYARYEAREVDQVCAIVRNWLQAELNRHRITPE